MPMSRDTRGRVSGRDTSVRSFAGGRAPSGTMVNPTPLRTKLYSVACVEWTCSSANTRQNSWKQFVVAAQITGETTTASWRTALDAVQRRHPLLGVCIDADDSADPYFHLHPELRIPLQIVPGDALQGWEDKMETELSTPFPVEDALLVRAVLLHEAHRATILLTAHHSVADGLSVALIVRDILEALSGKPLEALPVPQPQEDLCPPLTIQPLMSCGGLTWFRI
jgi:Condensation domain